MALCTFCRTWFAGVLEQSARLVNDHEKALRQQGNQHISDLFQSELHFDRDFETVRRSFPHCWLCFRLRLLQLTVEGIDRLQKSVSLEISITSWRITLSGGELEERYQIRIHWPRNNPFKIWLSLRFEGAFSNKDLNVDQPRDDDVDNVAYLYKLQIDTRKGEQSRLELASSNGNSLQKTEYSEVEDVWTPRFGKIKSMLNQCLQSHPSCSASYHRPSGGVVLPKRLVKLLPGDELSARLVETSDIGKEATLQYATLSYCWGDEPTCMLIKETYGAFKTAIPIGSLSKTIREALYVVSALGIQYVWIDSLCIIQDSPSSKDWSDEATNMHHIYGRSLLNLAATSSRKTSDGFLSPLGKTPLQDVGFLLPGGTLIKERRHKLGLLCTNIYKNAHLLTRGWILQESILSPRNLHWTGAQTIWQCNETLQCEITNEGFDAEESRFFMYQEPVAKIPATGQLDRLWCKIAAEFSRVDVTLPKDRFFALSGVAALFHERYTQLGLKTRYVAGCWEHRMIECISWTSLNRTHTRTARVKGLQVPSWSWLDTHYIDLETEGLDSLPSITAKVKAVQMQHEDPSQLFGPISSAQILLSAHVFECKAPASLQRDPTANLTYSDGTLTIWFQVSDDTVAEHKLDSLWGGNNNNGSFQGYSSGLFSLDQDASVPPGMPLTCAILGARSNRKPNEDRSANAKLWSQINALILMPCSEENGVGKAMPCYRRIGTLMLTRPSKSRHFDVRLDISAEIRLERTDLMLV